MDQDEYDDLIQQKKIPFGRYKGRVADKLSDTIKREIRKKYKGDDKDIINMLAVEGTTSMIASKKRTKRKTNKRTKRKKKKTKKRIKKTLYYFYMDKCPYCIQFESTWKKLQKEVKNIHYKKINGPKRKKMIKEFNVSQYPTLILESKGKRTTFEGDDRTLSLLKDFIQ